MNYMVIESIFYILFWLIFVFLLGLSFHYVKVAKGEGLSIVFGGLLFLLLLFALKPNLHAPKALNEIIQATVKFEWATFIIGGVVLGGLGFVLMRYLKDNKTAAKALSVFFTFIALLYGVSLIWMNSIAPFLSNALLGMIFIGIFMYLFFKKI
jgi:drug/metabolite transporter (DMT)-like permease